MTKVEYDQQLLAAKKAYERQVNSIKCRYSMENSDIEIGDIIQITWDKTTKIRVDEIQHGYTSLGSLPCAVYSGIILNKDNTPNKSGKTDSIYQDARIEYVEKTAIHLLKDYIRKNKIGDALKKLLMAADILKTFIQTKQKIGSYTIVGLSVVFEPVYCIYTLNAQVTINSNTKIHQQYLFETDFWKAAEMAAEMAAESGLKAMKL